MHPGQEPPFPPTRLGRLVAGPLLAANSFSFHAGSIMQTLRMPMWRGFPSITGQTTNQYPLRSLLSTSATRSGSIHHHAVIHTRSRPPHQCSPRARHCPPPAGIVQAMQAAFPSPGMAPLARAHSSPLLGESADNISPRHCPGPPPSPHRLLKLANLLAPDKHPILAPDDGAVFRRMCRAIGRSGTSHSLIWTVTVCGRLCPLPQWVYNAATDCRGLRKC